MSEKSKNHQTVHIFARKHTMQTIEDIRMPMRDTFIFKNNYIPYWILKIEDSKEFNSLMFSYPYGK